MGQGCRTGRRRRTEIINHADPHGEAQPTQGVTHRRPPAEPFRAVEQEEHGREFDRAAVEA